MLSLEEIKDWAESIEAQSISNLIKFCHNPAKPTHRAVTEIVFADGANEYRVWIFREFNIIYVDVFHKGVEGRPKRTLFSVSCVRTPIFVTSTRLTEGAREICQQAGTKFYENVDFANPPTLDF